MDIGKLKHLWFGHLTEFNLMTLTAAKGVRQAGLDISLHYSENRRETCMNNQSLLKNVSRYFEIAQKAAVSGSLPQENGRWPYWTGW